MACSERMKYDDDTSVKYVLITQADRQIITFFFTGVSDPCLEILTDSITLCHSVESVLRLHMLT